MYTNPIICQVRKQKERNKPYSLQIREPGIKSTIDNNAYINKYQNVQKMGTMRTIIGI